MKTSGEPCYPKAVPGAFGHIVLQKLADDLRESILKRVGIDILSPEDETRPGDSVVCPGGDREHVLETSEKRANDSIAEEIRDLTGEKDGPKALQKVETWKERADALQEIQNGVKLPAQYLPESADEKTDRTPYLVMYLTDAAKNDIRVRGELGLSPDACMEDLVFPSTPSGPISTEQWEDILKASGRNPKDYTDRPEMAVQALVMDFGTHKGVVSSLRVAKDTAEADLRAWKDSMVLVQRLLNRLLGEENVTPDNVQKALDSLGEAPEF